MLLLALSHSGFSPTLFSFHSIRIGGASALAAAAQPDSVIKIVGRWRSLEFLEYICMCNATCALALNALTDVTKFTVADVRRLCPGAQCKR